MRFFSDSMRHLVCYPYSIENLHAMARELGIKRCWFHAGSRYPHYDVPKLRVIEIASRTAVVKPIVVLGIVKGHAPEVYGL